MTKTISALMGLLLAGPAVAADWDHEANIDSAVAEIVASYRLGGVTAMQQLVGSCYGTLHERDGFDERLKGLEFCAGMDFAASHLERDGSVRAAPDDAYFAMGHVVKRASLIALYVPDPEQHRQILRAWASTAVGALERKGY